jgi:hypothetical protein
MQILTKTLLLIALVCSSLSSAQADCDSSFDPNGNFISNFVKPNSCYLILMEMGSGGGHAGDLNAIYNLAYYKTNPNYELIIIGTYPEARFMALAAYDDHQLSLSTINDRDVVPLTNQMKNPFTPGATYTANQKYAAVVSFGGIQPTNITPGCAYAGYNLRANILEAANHHTGITWTDYPGLPPGFPVHKVGPTAAGSVYVRSYEASPNRPPQTPLLLVRDLTTGCAITSDQAINVLQMIDVVTAGLYEQWMDADQIHDHYYFQNEIVGRVCYAKDPLSRTAWFRGGEFSPGDNPAASYSNTQLSPQIVNRLVTETQGLFMRFRFKVPTTPQYPCTGCAFDDSKELRYWSLSFQNQAITLASLPDNQIVRDGNGYASVVVRLGPTAPPTYVNAANGYTVLDLSQNPDIGTLASVVLRQLLPAATYRCSADQIPFATTEYNDRGGFMGEYVPAVDFVAGSALPPVADHLTRVDSCGLQPTQPPVDCASL